MWLTTADDVTAEAQVHGQSISGTPDRCTIYALLKSGDSVVLLMLISSRQDFLSCLRNHSDYNRKFLSNNRDL